MTTDISTLARRNCRCCPVELKPGVPLAHQWDFRSGSARSGCGRLACMARNCQCSPVVLKPGVPLAHERDFRAVEGAL
jgi:hypothetical protein